jgi:LacI family transcriptional regulator
MALPRGINLVVASNSRDPKLERKVVEGLLSRRVCGLIITLFSTDYSFLERVATPVVFLDRHPKGMNVGAVIVDDEGGAHRIVRHLAWFGHRRIAILTDDLTIETSRLRREGYLRAMLELDLPAEPELQTMGRVDAAQAEACTNEMLHLERPPTANFSVRSETSLGVVRALHLRQRTDIAFVSFGDFATADLLSPAITVIDHDPRMLARRGMELRSERLDGTPPSPDDVVVPVELIARGPGELAPWSAAT